MRLRNCIAAVVAGIVVLGVFDPPRGADGATFSGTYGQARVRTSGRRVSGTVVATSTETGLLMTGFKASVNLRRRVATATGLGLEAVLPADLTSAARSSFPISSETGNTATYGHGRTSFRGEGTEETLSYDSAGEPLRVTVTKYVRLRPDRSGTQRARVVGTFSGSMRKDVDSTLAGPDVISVGGRFNTVCEVIDASGL